MRTNPFCAAMELRHDGEDVLDGCVLETAEDSALAQELLQKGPADAQGQEDEREKTSADIAQGQAEDAQDREDDSGRESGCRSLVEQLKSSKYVVRFSVCFVVCLLTLAHELDCKSCLEQFLFSIFPFGFLIVLWLVLCLQRRPLGVLHRGIE